MLVSRISNAKTFNCQAVDGNKEDNVYQCKRSGVKTKNCPTYFLGFQKRLFSSFFSHFERDCPISWKKIRSATKIGWIPHFLCRCGLEKPSIQYYRIHWQVRCELNTNGQRYSQKLWSRLRFPIFGRASLMVAFLPLGQLWRCNFTPGGCTVLEMYFLYDPGTATTAESMSNNEECLKNSEVHIKTKDGGLNSPWSRNMKKNEFSLHRDGSFTVLRLTWIRN